jgi:mannosyltransferase
MAIITVPRIDKRVNVLEAELAGIRVYQYVLLTAITVLASILRWYRLGDWSFWVDEANTVRKALDLASYDLASRPISLTLIHAVLSVWGVNEWNSRLVPALIGMASIPILYFPVRKLVGPGVALVSVLLLAVSPWHLYWSQNARFYSSLLLFYTLGLFTFYFGLEEDRPRYLLASLVLFGLAFWEREIAILFVPVVLAYLVLLRILPMEKPRGLHWRNLALFFGLGAFLGLIAVAPYLRQPSQWVQAFGWIGYVSSNPFRIFSGVAFYIRLSAMCMATAGMIHLWSQRHRAALLLGLGAWIPLLVIVLLSPFFYTAGRYALISLPSWLILASVAAVELIRHISRSARILAIGVLLFLWLDPISEDVLYYTYQNGNRENWKEAFQLVRQKKQPGDFIISRHRRLGDYYMQESTLGFEQIDLSSIERSKVRIWFVEDANGKVKFPQVHHWIQENTRLISDFGTDVSIRGRSYQVRVFLYDPRTKP